MFPLITRLEKEMSCELEVCLVPDWSFLEFELELAFWVKDHSASVVEGRKPLADWHRI
jgi:hypothetical protein